MEPIVSTVTPDQLEGRLATLDKIEAIHTSQIQWFDCSSPEDYRHMRRTGGNGFPKPWIDPAGKTITIPSRDDHSIELRIIRPQAAFKGVCLHFHAGGFVIGSAKNYDAYLRELSESLSVVMVSVEYRLAPENPFPKGHNDCLDAALFALSAVGEETLGGPMRLIAGESAGACLAVWVALQLRDLGIDLRSRIAALLPTYGLFDMTYTPSVLLHKRRALLGKEETFKFVEATFEHVPTADRKAAQISPLYADLRDLPPALFIVGSEDPLLNDSVFMASRWQLAGNEAKLNVFPGACHAFTLFPMGELTEEGKKSLVQFAESKLG